MLEWIPSTISTLNSSFSLLERFQRWRKKEEKPAPESVAARFVRLFESHDVHRNQIPRFFGHGLTLQDMQDDGVLACKLDDAILDAACNVFAIRREWLEGADARAYPLHDFYKHPEAVEPFLKGLQASNPDGQLHGVLLAPEEKKGAALLVFEEVAGTIGEKPIMRYHLCENWLFDYWKSRAYLTACVAIAWKRRVHVRGITLSQKAIETLCQGETLLGDQREVSWGFVGNKWYPEDMALEPEAYLRSVDPERNGYGIQEGLLLWLTLDEKGYLSTCLDVPKARSARSYFIRALESHQGADSPM